MREESFAVFEFGGDASRVTSVVGLTPSRSWRKGESMGERGGIQTHDRWVFASPAPAEAEPEQKLEAFGARTADTLQRMAALNLSLDFDIYALGKA